MPKWLKFGTSVLSIFLYFALIVSVIALLEPIGYLIDSFGGNVAKSMVNDSQYLVVLHHTHVSQQAIANFPSSGYNILMAVGLAFGTVAAIMVAWAGLQILGSLKHKDYFSNDILRQLKRLVIAQCFSVIADFPIASANTLIRLNLFRVNSEHTVDWNDPIQDLFMLVIVGLVYFIYKRAVTLKQENELTI